MKSLLVVIIFVLTACSYRAPKEKPVVELFSGLTPVWFTQNSSHALYDKNEKPQVHLFFDINAEFNTKSVNVVVETPEDSSYGYELDLASGRRYFSYAFCPQSDVWNKYSGAIWKPTYTKGIIPGYLDQLGDPQSVLIFGNKSRYTRLTDHYFHRVKLVGAYIHQTCPEGNCLGKNNWLSRMVFLAVDPDDPRFSSITNLDSLKRNINWVQTVAVIENIEGRSGSAISKYPYTKVGNLIKLEDALKYYHKNSVHLDPKETQEIQQNCQKLYDRLWSDVGNKRPEDISATNPEELSIKLKLVNQLRKDNKPVGFAERLKLFTRNFYPEISTCERFVYHGNVNINPEVFWFLTQMTIFYRLHKDGFYFDCGMKLWQKNRMDANGRWYHVLKRDIKSCTPSDFDLAMNYLPNFLTGLKHSGPIYYRFVDYDTHEFGTHGKIYSWLKLKRRDLACSFDPNEEIRKQIKVFPDDVSWEARETKN